MSSSLLHWLVVAATPWAERLAARSVRADGTVEAPMPQASRSANVTRMLLDVTEDLRRFVHDDVERAIAVVQAQERRRGSQEDCFSTVAGTFLRYRCCVYYSALTAALMEARFGAVSSSSATHGLVTPYGALARWLLQPPAGVPDVAVAHASQLMAEADASNDGSYDLATLRRAAAQLPGPLGRYATRLSIRGVGGTLWRCELLTAHTYLVFVADEPGVDDVIVDVSFKQFLVVPEWMAAADFEACEAQRLFSELPEAFVGSTAELNRIMTLPQLRSAMVALRLPTTDLPTTDARGQRGGVTMGEMPPHWANPAALEAMHVLRTESLFALSVPRGGRQRLCGRPSQ